MGVVCAPISIEPEPARTGLDEIARAGDEAICCRAARRADADIGVIVCALKREVVGRGTGGAGALQAQGRACEDQRVWCVRIGVDDGGVPGQRDRAGQGGVAETATDQPERPEAGVGGAFRVCRIRQDARPGEAQVLCEDSITASATTGVIRQREDEARVVLHDNAARLARGGAERARVFNPQAPAADGGRAPVGVRVRERELARAADDEVGAAAHGGVGGFPNLARKGVVGAVVDGEGEALLDLDFARVRAAAEAADGLV